MYLVHPKRNSPQKWEVAWQWIPHFLAADLSLVEFVDQEMTRSLKESTETDLDKQMYWLTIQVVDLIQRKYPMSGLREYLMGVLRVEPEKRP